MNYPGGAGHRYLQGIAVTFTVSKYVLLFLPLAHSCIVLLPIESSKKYSPFEQFVSSKGWPVG